jgi:RNA polymerase primary sigma factor
MYWIRSAIKRDQIYQSRVIQVPPRLHENSKRINRIRNELKKALGRPPTTAELVHATGLPEAQIERINHAMKQRTYSLDQTITNRFKPNSIDENKESLYAIIESKTEENDYSRSEYNFLREDLINALHEHLTEEEATLLMLRYGLIENQNSVKRSGIRTIAEVSNIVGLKPDKVRRLLNRSLNQLQAVIGDEWLDYERDLEAGFESTF